MSFFNRTFNVGDIIRYKRKCPICNQKGCNSIGEVLTISMPNVVGVRDIRYRDIIPINRKNAKRIGTVEYPEGAQC